MSWIPWTEWECYPAGMFDGGPRLSPDAGREMYAEFLRDIGRFNAAMRRVAAEWPKSCEHFLTKPQTNRVAWLGQASMCIDTGVSRKHRAGFKDLSASEQTAANAAAQEFLDEWLAARENQHLCVHMEAQGLSG